jgi:ketosteroid isomerase-like protein
MNRTATLLLPAVLAFAVPAAAQGAADDAAREADAAAIRAHIERICQAFVDGDVTTIRATHTEDWRGFLETSRTPIKGIDDYMRANGIPWPPPSAPAPRAATPNPTRGFRVFDFDVHFYGPDLAVASFFVDFGEKAGADVKTATRYRIMDVYARRNGAWNQAASHTVVDPVWRAEQTSRPAALPPPAREQLLAAREAVWRAYFTNDQAALDKLVPGDAVVLEGPLDAPFVRKPQILEEARRSAERGLHLVRLEFPQTEIQVFGTTAIIYTTYLFELENGQGQRQTTTGRATEVFVRRDGAWVNPGWQMSK